MINISLDLSGKIDAQTADLLLIVSTVAEKLKIGFFVAGATARDVILEQGYEIKVGRKTQDVDLAVVVENWDVYTQLKTELLASSQFVEDPKAFYRLRFKNILPVDLIPFGSIESPPGSITWPPDHSIKMSVIGFEDAWKHTLNVRIQPTLTVRFASLPGLTILKLIAWNDRRHAVPQKDAADLALVLRKYAEAGNEDRLYKEHEDLLGQEGFDLELAGAWLLGQDMSKVMQAQTREVILDLLKNQADPDKSDRLIIQISNELSGNDTYEMAAKLLKNLSRGISESK
jgi:predicted nucleotidyltransferase